MQQEESKDDSLITQRKVRDSYHCRGKYIGVVHGIYNSKYRTCRYIVVVFLNRSNSECEVIKRIQRNILGEKAENFWHQQKRK